MTNVVDLGQRRIEQAPHSAGPARCLHCRHEWVAVVPAGSYHLECPSCGLMYGALIHAVHAAAGEYVIACSVCQCDLFFVMAPGVLRCHRCANQVGEVTIT